MSTLLKRLHNPVVPAIAVALFSLLSPACAQDAPRKDPAHYVTWENDSRYYTDRFYTSGVQISAKYATDRRGDFARDLTHTICSWMGCDASTVFISQRNLGQLIFTPRDITQPESQPEDRPWAGYLYYEKIYSFLSSDQRTITTITGQVGATGPISLAEDAQKAFHNIFDRPRPLGWHNQIGGSLGVLVSAEKRTARESLSFDLPAGVRFNTASYWRVAAGNVQTYAAAGLAIVIGKDLPPVSPPPPGIGNKLASKRTSPISSTSCLAGWLQCTGFASVEGRLVAYNVFLDGRLFRDDPDVDKRVFVYDVVVGNRFDLPRTRRASHGPWFVQVKATHRSPEFRSRLTVPSHRVYGITVGTEF